MGSEMCIRDSRQARVEAAEMIAKARADADRSADDLRARAEEELRSLRQQAHREIEAARESAIKDINTHAADVSTAIAGRILEREIRSEDQRDLIDRTLQELSEAHTG